MIGEVLEHARNLVELVQAAQHLRAAVRHRGRLLGRLNSADGVSGTTGAHSAALLIHYSEDNTPIHPARLIRLDVPRLLASILRLGFAESDNFNLVGASSVLNEEIADRVAAGQSQFLVVSLVAYTIRVAFDPDLIAGVFLQQFRQTEKAREPIDKHCRVELEIDFLPIILGRFSFQSLGGERDCYKRYNQEGCDDPLQHVWSSCYARHFGIGFPRDARSCSRRS